MTRYICLDCEYIGKRKAIKKGSLTVEILLWVTLLIPGPFYSLWRIRSKEYVCPHCESRDIVSTESLAGRTMLKKLEEDISPEAIAGMSSTLVNIKLKKLLEEDDEPVTKPEGDKPDGW